MKIIKVLFACFLVLSTSLSFWAQEKESSFVSGAGLFYFPEKETLAPGYWYFHHQLNANAYFGYNLFKNYFRFGGEARIMHYWSEIYPKHTFYMLGWYNQFNIFPKAKWGRIFIEVGLHQGNLYPVRHSYELQVVPGLFYLGFGWGGNIRLSPHLDIYTEVNLFPTLNQDYFSYYYGNAEFGLEYYFHKRPKKKIDK